LQHGIDTQLAATHHEQDDLWWRSGPLLKALSLEYAPLAADLYGRASCSTTATRHVTGQTNLDLLWPLLDVTTTLDPNLIVAYHFGGMFSERLSAAGAGQPQQGIKLLERGFARIRNTGASFRILDLSITLTCGLPEGGRGLPGRKQEAGALI